ncbi:MAG: DNA methyltransferase [Helicobacter sp.]|nr:DNA methyltransferase [Helicobacter sp.]
MLEKYLNDIKDMEESTKELQYRGALEWLLNAIKEALNVQNMQIIHEPPNDKGGKGAPDFWILKNGLTLGYIENKRVNENLEKIAQSEQIAKYLNLSENLMICDYLEFAIVALEEGKAKIINCFRICDLCDLKALNLIALEQKQAELLEFFKLFYNKNPKPIVKALEFAEVLAQRTRILNYYLFLNFDNDYIQGTFKILKRVLYKDLKIDDFCDSFAQTLTYTLFLARLNNKTQEKITLENIKRFIPRVFELLRDLSGFLNNLYEVEPNDKQDSNRAYHLKLLLNEIITIINNINVAELEKELNQIREKDLEGNYLHKDPYLHFYETFLKKYDYELRIVRGVYYTPAPVVGFIINSIDLILQKDFNKKAGLKEAKRQDSNIRLLDFATGTGTFLLEAFRKTLESTKPTNEKGHKRLEYDNEIKSVVDKFYGFEFLIAPYVIAHLKISQELKESFEFDLDKKYKEYKEQYKKPIRLNIVLTDTLYSASEIDEINKNYTLFAGGLSLAKEFEKACDIKNEEILIIAGNPPYNALSQNKYDIEAYKYCGLKSNSENSKISINERKHRLNDDYIKFIRFAESKIQKQQQGIFAIISNNSFIDAGTMRGMRWNLLNTFDEIYILNLHGDNNKKETCPDGSPDVNVFDIKQGVSINIFIKTKPKEVKFSNTPKCKVYYYDLYGTRHYKYSFFK